MNVLPRLLVYLCALLPIFYFCYEVFFLGKGAANPVEFITHSTGNATFYLLLFLLWIAPLRLFPPLAGVSKKLTRHKRFLGLVIYFYASLHLLIFAIDQFIASDWVKPFIFSGFASYLILSLMAFTSFKKTQRKLPWKKIHRLVYLILPLIAIHITLKEEGNMTKALIFMVPLFVVENLRFKISRLAKK
ncbi:MAG: ferric reductase-like transmembrane domain-containing protein [SAR324 cluster bacterium]|nr:ferric reductase-like transmembrane domain-containing protein [SAR324 cluster bacterium]